MRIKKMLIIPSTRVVPGNQSNESLLRRLARFVKYGFKLPWPYSPELPLYADIPKVLGKENTFILGKYKSFLLSKEVPSWARHSSVFGTPEGTFIARKDLDGVLKQIDAVLISHQASRHIIDLVSRKARAKNIPVAMIDNSDHSLYGASDQEKRKIIFRGFIPGRHFDLYFKQDLWLGYKTDKVFPVAPPPVRPESYNFEVVPKDKTIFFSGRMQPTNLYQGDRAEVPELIEKNFPNTMIIRTDSRENRMNLKEYWHNISRSQMALSPSGFSWGSPRICDVGLAPSTCLIAPKTYIEVVEPYLVDGKNAILYDTEVGEDERHHLSNPSDLIEKVRYYLGHPEEREKIAKNWQDDVLRGHTTLSRAKYIIESIERVFS